MSSMVSRTEEIAEKRIGLTLVIHGIFLLGSSAILDVGFLLWFPINLAIEVLIILELLRMWKRYKYNSKSYYTIQVYWMLMGTAIYSVLPILRLMYVTDAFWLVLVFTILLFIYAHLIREKIAEVFVNPKKEKSLWLLIMVFSIIVFIGVIIMAILRAKSYHPNLGLIIVLYMVGGMMLFLATPFSVSAERFEKLKKGERV